MRIPEELWTCFVSILMSMLNLPLDAILPNRTKFWPTKLSKILHGAENFVHRNVPWHEMKMKIPILFSNWLIELSESAKHLFYILSLPLWRQHLKYVSGRFPSGELKAICKTFPIKISQKRLEIDVSRRLERSLCCWQDKILFFWWESLHDWCQANMLNRKEKSLHVLLNKKFRIGVNTPVSKIFPFRGLKFFVGFA